jgi:ribonuclease HI
VTVVSSFPLGEIIQCREASGRIAKWAVELMGETLSFAPRKAIKSQVLADFLAEWVDTQLPTAPTQAELWTMYFDGSLMKTGACAGLLFISPLEKHVRYVIRLHFPTSNNVAEYEALVNGLRIAIKLGVRRLDARGDSQLVIDQVMKNSHCRDRKMEAYCDEVQRLEDKFYGLELNHVARWYNETADELAKIASGRTTVPPDVFSRDIYQPSVKLDDVPEPEETSAQPEVPSVAEGEALRIEGERNGVAPNQNWQTLYLEYLLRGELPLDKAEARRLARRAKSFVLLGDEKELYHRSPSGILQRCISVAHGAAPCGVCCAHGRPRPAGDSGGELLEGTSSRPKARQKAEIASDMAARSASFCSAASTSALQFLTDSLRAVSNPADSRAKFFRRKEKNGDKNKVTERAKHTFGPGTLL